MSDRIPMAVPESPPFRSLVRTRSARWTPKSFLVRVLVLLLLVVGLARCGEPDPGLRGSPDVEVPVQGGEPPAGKTKRTFTFRAPRAVQQQDFLFVLDTSGSMGEEVDTMRQEVANLFAEVNARRDVDANWAVANTNAERDEGEPYGVVTKDSPDPVAAFDSLLARVKADVMAWETTRFSGIEMGLRAAMQAVRDFGSRFMRPAVPLAVVIVTDAADVSGDCRENFFGVTCDFHDIDRYSRFFKDMRGPDNTPSKALMYPLAARTGKECSGLEDDMESDWPRMGDRYFQVQQAVGTGFFGSVCGNRLAGDLREVGRQISRRGICRDLPHSPEAILSVKVGGQAIPASAENGYVFDKSTGSCCFPGSYQPPEDAEVVVEYY